MLRSVTFQIFLLLATLLAGSANGWGQTTLQTSFGKNRVQYHRQFDEWMLYETPNFVTYWYGDARNVAQATLQTAEYDFPYVQQLLEHQMMEKITVLVFSDLTDLKQSNIGEDEIFQLRAGETKVVGSKIFVFFDGDHNHLRVQIREGVAGVLINSMLFGSNLQEIVQNAVLLNLPGWYTNGLAAYCGEEWSPELDDQFRDILLAGKYKTFDRLARDHPRLAGHAFWYYISLHYGRGTVSNLLYLTRINRGVDAGFLYVLGNGYRRTTDAMMEYFQKRYDEEARGLRTPPKNAQIAVKNKKKLPLSQLKISPDGKRIAWVSNNIGRWRVYVQDLKTGKRSLLLKGGARNALQTPDYNYPLLAWNPDNRRLAVLYERRDVARIAVLDLDSGKKELADLSPEYQRVFSLDYLSPTDFVLSAAVRGYSDLFIYRTVTRQTERLTQDFWDDLDAAVATLDGRKGILFASNRVADTLSPQRLDTILPLRPFDIFYLDLENRSNELVRITNTPLVNERQPLGVDSAYFVYRSDERGVHNRQAGYLEPYIAYYQHIIYLKDGIEVKALDMRRPGEWPPEKALAILAPLDTVLQNIDSTQIDSIRGMAVYKKRPVTWNQTNYDRNLLEHDLSPRTGRLVEAMRRGNRTVFYQHTLQPNQKSSAWLTRYRELQLRQLGLPLPEQPPLPAENEEPPALNGNDTLPGVNPLPDTIPPGWLLQVPDYLRAPAAAEPARPPVPKPEAPPAVTPTQPDSMLLMPARPQRSRRPWLEIGQENTVLRFNPSQIVPYRLKFRTDYVATTMDNNLLFDGLEVYNDSLSRFRTPPAGVLIRANFKDLLENYVIEAGFRLPTTFNGTEFYVWMDDKKRRLDRRYVLYRRTQLNNVPRMGPNANLQPPEQQRTNTLLAQYEVRYPLDVFFSLRGTVSLRQDKTIVLSSDEQTLERPDVSEQRAMLRLAAVYDNVVDIDLNLRTGTRARLYADVVKRFAFNTQPDWSLRVNDGFMTVIGLDARHYRLLDRRSILALRLAGATSFGSERMLYLLGGVDNWLFPPFNENIVQPSPDRFAFRTLATNLRGFEQNIRNGNSYALLNAELRVPIFKYFSRKPVMGNFWRNFQLVGFFDAGTAWQGDNPYDGDNPINIRDIDDNLPTVFVRVKYFRDPLVAGYGVGLRTMIFGMYLRIDHAWGIETRVVQPPIWHFALGADF